MQKVVETLTPDNWMPVDVEPLSPFERTALAHWTRFLPKMVKELKQRGGQKALETEVRKAAHLMEYETATFLAEHPDLHRIQALEFTRPTLFLPPEM